MKGYFQFDRWKTSYKQESIAGLTTFLSMAYILFVNPLILADAGMDEGAVFTATALSAAIGTLIMGIIARYPIALAPGMGLNAFFAYTVVLGIGVEWQLALFGVLLSGIIFIFITLLGIREKIINAIPAQLKYAVAAGIGLFIAFVGLLNAGIVVPDESTAVTLGNMTSPTTLLACFGLIVTAVLMVLGLKGGIFYGLVITAIAGVVTGLIGLPDAVVGSVPSLAPTFGSAFTILGEVEWTSQLIVQMIIVVLTFLFVDFFDTAGTLFAVANQAGYVKDNKLPRAGRALLSDSTATSIGAVLGTSTTTAFIESSSGVAAGGRTGFTSVVTAGLFLLSMFFSPLLVVVTEQVTAPALIIVGVLMASSLRLIEWDKLEVAIPAFLTVIAMPLTYSIATGIALGFIFYPITMILKGKSKEVHPVMYVLFIVFILYFGFLGE
ncbi:putative MFS transporter, AGZA family, xanthine/uracil permease [Alteribacillus persepolensis]|uniref:Putative MFS transporter, AGZA family, xanthine/uracil permease n=1 Tax=Alteribacillus persepolensis TaxID=568899 RepID=A0A1G8F7H2_9BACI|nr:NCS2 family permease [Alteribacillus persepolensis]SDH78058.1 putative MFS transporter, AGZA family, xanthine/uracil permease [Alteribacillus persepolensis]